MIEVIDLIDGDIEDDIVLEKIQMILTSMDIEPLTKQAIHKLKRQMAFQNLKQQLKASIESQFRASRKISVNDILNDELPLFNENIKSSVSHQLAIVSLLHIAAD